MPRIHRHPLPVQILLVEDEESVRKYAVRVLEAEGYSIYEAVDGAEALALLQSGTCQPRLVVSDIVMPRITGVQLLETLSISYPELPCLLMSGYAAGELAARGITVPCGVLAKPFSPEQLVEEVRRCLEAGDSVRAS